jgi:pimeloyl-ACP methyl ester carboxylesterase
MPSKIFSNVLILATLLLTLHGCAGTPDATSEGSLAGPWLGSFEIDGRATYASLTLSTQDGQLQGTMELPFEGETGIDVTDLQVKGRAVRFEVARPDGAWSFVGKRGSGRASGRLEGEVTQTGRTGRFRFAAVAGPDGASYDSYVGTYRIPPDRVISVAPYRGEMGCSYPVAVDFSNGRIRALFPQGEDRFMAGPSLLVPLPVEATVEFERDGNGQVSGLSWRESGGPAWTASRIAYPHEAVRFKNGEVVLAGTLTFPAAEGPHPAVILIHGSGPQPRDHAVLKWIADYFVLNGLAVLAYDKRGVGESTGSWNDATIEDLAKDALAGLAYLKSRPEIQPEKIGLWGISQGGWISTLAAARSSDVAFIIIVSGAGVSITQQDVDRIELTLRMAGFPESEVQAAVAYQRLFYDALDGKAGWEELEASMERSRQAPWAGYVTRPASKERFVLRAPIVRRFFAYDPASDLERVSCPVLALFGGRDIIVPPDRNIAPMEQGLKRGGNADYTIKVFPTGDHVLQETPTGAMRDGPFLKELVPGYLETMRAWLEAKLR